MGPGIRTLEQHGLKAKRREALKKGTSKTGDTKKSRQKEEAVSGVKVMLRPY
jgi:hypothetical protein